jgi:glycine cleavage system T protein (aminomethyltransferase)
LNAPTFPLLLDRGGEDEREESKLEAPSDYVAFLRNICLSLVSLVTEAAPKKTPLYDEHVRLNAKMVPFAGWLMPVQYTSIAEEHRTVRNSIGIFDISHMGQLIVGGLGAREWLNIMLTNNIDKLDAGMGQYTFLLNEGGGIIDDLIAYRIGKEKFLLVVNASRTDDDLAWLQKHLRGDVDIDNRSANFGGVAIQGPGVTNLFENLPSRNHIVDLHWHGIPVTIARTGYTGEDGVEVFFRAMDAAKFWNLVLEKGKEFGIKPCGLGARDTLRLEMCYPLNGSDLSPDRNPIEAGLGFFVDLSKPGFTGRDVLLKTKENGPREKLVPFRMKDKGPPPRPHYGVFSGGCRSERIGEVTSGTLSPSLNWGVGMAYVSAAHAKIGAEIEIEIRSQKFPATIEKKPLYKKSAS